MKKYKVETNRGDREVKASSLREATFKACITLLREDEKEVDLQYYGWDDWHCFTGKKDDEIFGRTTIME